MLAANGETSANDGYVRYWRNNKIAFLADLGAMFL